MNDLYTLTIPHDLDPQVLLRAISETIAERERLREENARLAEVNRYLIGISNEAMEDARKYAEAQTEIARLREALSNLLAAAEGQGGTKHDAHEIARAALAPVVTK